MSIISYRPCLGQKTCYVLKNSKFILVTFLNKSIRLWFGNDGADGADGTIIAKSQTNGFIEKSY